MDKDFSDEPGTVAQQHVLALLDDQNEGDGSLAEHEADGLVPEHGAEQAREQAEADVGQGHQPAGAVFSRCHNRFCNSLKHLKLKRSPDILVEL